jgi:hypothetical protein
MSEAIGVDFQSLWRQGKPIQPRDITLVGGRMAETEVISWLERWDLDKLCWRMWESVSEIKLEEKTALPNIQWLERGRIFGESGDLTLRRDGAQFRWWFIGDKDFRLLENHGGHDFWDNPSHQRNGLFAIRQEAILWGAYQSKTEEIGRNEPPLWYDDRVGYAKLFYPASLAGNRHIYARYYEYLDRGRVIAVRMYDLVGKK